MFFTLFSKERKTTTTTKTTTAKLSFTHIKLREKIVVKKNK